jgi:SAM-dependent methyltransferase
MFNTTLARLRCPARARAPKAQPKTKAKGAAHAPAPALCGSKLALHADRAQGSGAVFDVLAGRLDCPSCQARFPILAGVAIVVPDVRGFLFSHVKGVMQLVPAQELPKELARELKAAHAELETGHIEDDLEAERVVSLYMMNHYLDARSGDPAWWRPSDGTASSQPSKGSPFIASLVREYWDHGPLSRIQRLVESRMSRPDGIRVIELGCGVGGLAWRLKKQASAYLGVDSSFASVALARHLALGAPYDGDLRIPEDLLQGPVSRKIRRPARIEPLRDGRADFVVGDLEAAPVARGEWDLSIALNAIDMLEEPSALPALQRELSAPSGRAIQSCPYIWHELVARKLRARLPKSVRDSASAAEWLYEREGFKVLAREEHVPWLFFKHLRQLELYSVHLFIAASTD